MARCLNGGIFSGRLAKSTAHGLVDRALESELALARGLLFQQGFHVGFESDGGTHGFISIIKPAP